MPFITLFLQKIPTQRKNKTSIISIKILRDEDLKTMEDIEVAEMRVRHVQANLDTFQKVLDYAKTRFLPNYCVSTPIKIEKVITNKENDLLKDTPSLKNNDEVVVLDLKPAAITKHTGKNKKTGGHNTNNIVVDLIAEENDEVEVLAVKPPITKHTRSNNRTIGKNTDNIVLNNNDNNNIKKNVKGQKRSNEATINANLSNKRNKNDVKLDNVKQLNPDNYATTNTSEGTINQLNPDSKEGNNHVIETVVLNTASCTNATSTLLNSMAYREQLVDKIIDLRNKIPPDAQFDVNDALHLTLREIFAIEIKRHPNNAYIESKSFKNHLISNIMKNKNDSKYMSWNTMQIIVNEIYLLDKSYQKQQLDKDNNKKNVSERKRIQLINDATTLNRLEGIKQNNISEIENELVTKSLKKMDNIVKQSEKDILSKVSIQHKEIKKVSKIQEDYRERRKRDLDFIKQNESTGAVRVKDKKIAGKVCDDNNIGNNNVMVVQDVGKNNSPILLEKKKNPSTKTNVEISKNDITNNNDDNLYKYNDYDVNTNDKTKKKNPSTKTNVEISKNNIVNDVQVMVSNLLFVL